MAAKLLKDAKKKFVSPIAMRKVARVHVIPGKRNGRKRGKEGARLDRSPIPLWTLATDYQER